MFYDLLALVHEHPADYEGDDGYGDICERHEEQGGISEGEPCGVGEGDCYVQVDDRKQYGEGHRTDELVLSEEIARNLIVDCHVSSGFSQGKCRHFVAKK